MFNAYGLVSASFLIFGVIAVSAARTPPQSVGVGSFRGRIVDADTGQPAAVTLVARKWGEPQREIDVEGEFLLSDLPLGRYQLSFLKNGIRFGTVAHFVQVTGSPAATPADIHVRLPGEIHGVVSDSQGRPIQGSRVLLVTIEYYEGHAVYTTFTNEETTDDQGYFSFSARTEAGRPYFLLALPPEAARPTLSGTPSFEATWYPSRPGDLQPFVLRSAERKRVDLVMQEKKTHCVDGKLTEDGKPAALGFEIAVPEVAGFLARSGGTQGVVFRGRSDTSGQFKVCGLWPGEFLVAAGVVEVGSTYPQNFARSYGRTNVSIADSDVHDVLLNAQSPVTLTGEIRLDNPQVPQQTYRLSFYPLSRVLLESFPSNRIDVTVPSKFAIPLLPSTDYWLFLNIPGATPDTYLNEVPYLKEVTWAPYSLTA